jgi:hypothetical protein
MAAVRRTVAECQRALTLSNLRRREAQLADQRRALQYELAAIIADPLRAGWNEPEAAELDGRIRESNREWNATVDQIRELLQEQHS